MYRVIYILLFCSLLWNSEINPYSDVTTSDLYLMVPSLCPYSVYSFIKCCYIWWSNIWIGSLPIILQLCGWHSLKKKIQGWREKGNLPPPPPTSQQIDINLVWRSHYLNHDLLLVPGTYTQNFLNNIWWFL